VLFFKVLFDFVEVSSKTIQKAFGAFYTPEKAVDFMIRWAVRQPLDLVIDPSYGDGIFLKRSVSEVTTPQEQIYGVEFDKMSYEKHKPTLTQLGITRIYPGNFFEFDSFPTNNPQKITRFEAVVGNPPFIRYQLFKGSDREIALEKAKKQGVVLPGHASSWAPFFIHATSLIKPQGRLAMVAPAELGHAAYAKSVMQFLIESFEKLSILTFRKKLFPQLGEDTFIVLGENRGKEIKCFEIVDIESIESLAGFDSVLGFDSVGKVRKLTQHEIDDLHNSRVRLLEYLVNDKAIHLYKNKILKNQNVVTLGTICDVGIGYVTGNNDFFHLSKDEIKKYKIPKKFYRPTIRRGNYLKGAEVTKQDWEEKIEEKKYLLTIDPKLSVSKLPKGLKKYLAKAEAEGVLNAFKVKSRQSWYSVPHVENPEAFLTYMSNLGAYLVQNTFGAPAPNTLHTVKIKDSLFDKVSIRQLVISWYTSLTFFSAELEGHSLGGGMLKIEPGEARKIPVALPPMPEKDISRAFLLIDQLLREDLLEAALDVGDKYVLQGGLKLSKRDCETLRENYHILRDRRTKR
jgi:adenine-specific DNA-methyltransferase